LQTSQLGDMDKNVDVKHSASTSQWLAPLGLTVTAHTALKTTMAYVSTA